MSNVYKMNVVVTRSPFEAAGSEVDISEKILAEMISSKLYVCLNVKGEKRGVSV